MREIKFRGKDIDCNEWRYGSLVKVRENDGYLLYYIVDEENQQWIAFPETVGQYTGLKDKNGKEIYEGDIVEKTYYSYHQPECSELFEIKYEGLGFYFEHIKGNTFYLPFTEDIEVIGNIYDNPELLEAI